jgi:polysaccharide pyruvyl transferase WcaK-like protein
MGGARTFSSVAMNRRDFVQTAVAAGAWPLCCWGQEARPKRILLRSSWQTFNIGDIAHTPGVLALLERYLPEVEVRLWPTDLGGGVDKMLRRRFPKLIIIEGRDAIQAAFAECDFLLHGSGPSLVAAGDVARWRRETGKPYGILGITIKTLSPTTIELIGGAKFAFFRDSVSLRLAQDRGIGCPAMEFGPDGAFAVDLRNDAAASEFLEAHGLQRGKYLCCIPRLRYTPYWLFRKRSMDSEVQRKRARNEEMKEHDHAPLREAITAVTRQTDMKVLVCPEDRSQMAVGKEMLVDPLPNDVKTKVVWREHYWLTDEAVSTYVRSAGLFGLEMHSPIMCIGNGIPAIVCRFDEQTSKGLMWRDIGLSDWLFDMDDRHDVSRLVSTVLAMAHQPAAAKAKVARAMEFVRKRERRVTSELRRSIPQG